VGGEKIAWMREWVALGAKNIRSPVSGWVYNQVMQNYFGQQIVKGDTVIQIARTSNGMVRRVGVVLGDAFSPDEIEARVGWYDPEVLDTSVSESVVGYDYIVKVDPQTLPPTMIFPLGYALQRGRAAL
jgi:hypothetical protein